MKVEDIDEKLRLEHSTLIIKIQLLSHRLKEIEARINEQLNEKSNGNNSNGQK